MRRSVSHLLTTLFLALLFANCSDVKVRDKQTTNPVPEEGYQDNGDFKLFYQLERANGLNQEILSELRNNRVINQIVSQLNQKFKLPYNIHIYFKKMNTLNAIYSNGTINFSTELVYFIYNAFSKYYKDGELRQASMNAITFILLHEIGHALTHAYKLQVLGNEEIQVDNFSLFLLTSGDEEAQSAAIDGAALFNEFSKEFENVPANELPLWDEHSLDKQRFYDILCMVYGKNPSKYNYLVTENILPQRQTQRCIETSATRMNSWQEALKNYIY